MTSFPIGSLKQIVDKNDLEQRETSIARDVFIANTLDGDFLRETVEPNKAQTITINYKMSGQSQLRI